MSDNQRPFEQLPYQQVQYQQSPYQPTQVPTPGAPGARPPGKRRKVVLWVLGGVVVAAVLAALGLYFLPANQTSSPAGQPSASASPSAFAISGTVTVEAGAASDSSPGGDCFTEGGYSDISAGAQVTIRNESGTVIALGSLDPGHTLDTGKCIFGFAVSGVPEGETFYSVEVSHRGEVRFQRPDLNTEVQLSLGN